MNTNATIVESIRKSQTYLDYQKAYSEATGLPLALRPVETWQLPMHGQRKENPFCSLIAGKSRACAACLRAQESLSISAKHEPATTTCLYGLCETAVPVKLGSETIGFLQTGQVMRQKPTNTRFDGIAKRLEEDGLNLPAARKAFLQTPVFSQKKLDSTAQLLSIFAEHLSMKSNQLAIHQANAEPPVITKAKQFINENYMEDLSLEQVAKTVHTSTFYFCKLFKKATGINFTEFVSRIRTEKAKNLLLNPNLRVSEIAYEIGFQSLTHFNRVFKRVVGQSPSQYRQQLVAA
jgi:AraC-like DNA-binding protein